VDAYAHVPTSECKRTADRYQSIIPAKRGIQPGFHHTPVDGVRSIARVKQLAADTGAEIFYSHDMDAWQGYLRAPDFYEL